MATATTIPVIISDEAAARVAELGMQREFERIIEHTRQTLPGLCKIECCLSFHPEEPETPPTTVIHTHRPHLGVDNESAINQGWVRWFVETFPPEVAMQFTMLPFFEDGHGR